MRLHLLTVLLPVALLSIACEGDDPSRLGGDVVGSWRELPSAIDENPPSVELRTVVTFGADGTWTEVSPGNSDVATYAVDGGNLVLTFGEGADERVYEIPYRATADRFVFGALVPVGEVDRMIGAWTATAVMDGVSSTVDVTLRADGTATHARTGAEAATFQGTWRAVGDDIESMYTDGTTTFFTRSSLVDGVLGEPHERI